MGKQKYKKRRSKDKSKKIIITVILLLLVSGIGAGMYYFVYAPHKLARQATSVTNTTYNPQNNTSQSQAPTQLSLKTSIFVGLLSPDGKVVWTVSQPFSTVETASGKPVQSLLLTAAWVITAPQNSYVLKDFIAQTAYSLMSNITLYYGPSLKYKVFSSLNNLTFDSSRIHVNGNNASLSYNLTLPIAESIMQWYNKYVKTGQITLFDKSGSMMTLMVTAKTQILNVTSHQSLSRAEIDTQGIGGTPIVFNAPFSKDTESNNNQNNNNTYIPPTPPDNNSGGGGTPPKVIHPLILSSVSLTGLGEVPILWLVIVIIMIIVTAIFISRMVNRKKVHKRRRR